MLIGFSVSNYRSFYERETISFIATKIARHKEHVYSVGNRRILKSGLIFGANAGGKSNFVRAINFSRKIVLLGIDSVDLTKQNFRIKEGSLQQPGVFEYRLMVDEHEYSYGIVISYEKKEIISEWLTRITKSGEEKVIYNREVDEYGISHAETKLSFIDHEEENRMKIYLSDFDKNISDSLKRKSILNDLAMRGTNRADIFAELKRVYNWFQHLVIIFPTSRFTALNEITSDTSQKEFFTHMARFFDTGIESVEGQRKELDFDKFLEKYTKGDAEKIKLDLMGQIEKKAVRVRINDQMLFLRRDKNGHIVYNKMLLNHGNKKDLFEYGDESDGTKRLFDLIPLLSGDTRNSVIIVDEIDRSLHVNLLKEFFEVFYQNMADLPIQLVATTHNANLLDLEILRQDEIWFVERQKDHSSKLFSLNKFKERFDKKIDKEYLLGRYGAIPVFAEGQDDIDG